MKFLLGHRCYHPETGEPAEVVGSRNGKAVARTTSGKVFTPKGVGRAPRRKPNAGRPCLIRIKGQEVWFEGVWVKRKRARIVSPDPIWFGAEVTREDADIEHVKVAKGAN